ncbi:DNA mismatch endonuclease Vsr [Rhizobium leguminosarum bv. viciae]|nr:DNA mismatch endonuclease Vsr [Rhizobium leguminosarum bv. viciae]
MESKEHISWRMSRVRGKHTTPELLVRRLIFSMGYRYRLHSKEIPGKPDLVFKGRRKVILVHGCFWHNHESDACKIAHAPKSNGAYWQAKLQRNRARDVAVRQMLIDAGWTCLVLWECQLKDEANLKATIQSFLGPLEKPVRPQDLIFSCTVATVENHPHTEA